MEVADTEVVDTQADMVVVVVDTKRSSKYWMQFFNFLFFSHCFKPLDFLFFRSSNKVVVVEEEDGLLVAVAVDGHQEDGPKSNAFHKQKKALTKHWINYNNQVAFLPLSFIAYLFTNHECIYKHKPWWSQHKHKIQNYFIHE